MKTATNDSQKTLGALYSIPTVCRILHLDPKHVRRWVQGYKFYSGKPKKARFSEPVIVSPVYESNHKTLVTFEQMIELLFIDLFEQRGVKIQVIRAAAKRLAFELGIQHPLAMPHVFTDNIRIYKQQIAKDASQDDVEEAAALLDLALMGQAVIEPFVQSKLEQINYADRVDMERFWPLGKDKLVVMDRNVSFGRPIVPESRVPTDMLYGMVKSGESVESVADWFEVEKKAVIDAIEFETQLGYRLKRAA